MDEIELPRKRLESPPRPLVVLVVLSGMAGLFNLPGLGFPGTWPFSVAAGLCLLAAAGLAWSGKRIALHLVAAGFAIDVLTLLVLTFTLGGWVLLAWLMNLHIVLAVTAAFVTSRVPVVRAVFDTPAGR